jgi:hypothetical protein
VPVTFIEHAHNDESIPHCHGVHISSMRLRHTHTALVDGQQQSGRHPASCMYKLTLHRWK